MKSENIFHRFHGQKFMSGILRDIFIKKKVYKWLGRVPIKYINNRQGFNSENFIKISNNGNSLRKRRESAASVNR